MRLQESWGLAWKGGGSAGVLGSLRTSDSHVLLWPGVRTASGLLVPTGSEHKAGKSLFYVATSSPNKAKSSLRAGSWLSHPALPHRLALATPIYDLPQDPDGEKGTDH